MNPSRFESALFEVELMAYLSRRGLEPRYEQLTNGQTPDFAFSFNGHEVLLEARYVRLPDDLDKRIREDLIAERPIRGPFGAAPMVEKIREALKKKRQKYAQSANSNGMPFVVAICVMDPFYVDEWAELAFCGETALTGALDSEQGIVTDMELVRRNNGSVSAYKQNSTQRTNTTISAMMFCKLLTVDRGRVVIAKKVYHNPFASVPLSHNLFSELPQYVKDESMSTADTVYMSWINPS
jgi:hypothetical protein